LRPEPGAGLDIKRAPRKRLAKGSESNPVVTISTGQLRGSLTADGVAVFKNIPFATTAGWRSALAGAESGEAWTGVRDATVFGPMCHQNDNKQLPHSEGLPAAEMCGRRSGR